MSNIQTFVWIYVQSQFCFELDFFHLIVCFVVSFDGVEFCDMFNSFTVFFDLSHTLGFVLHRLPLGMRRIPNPTLFPKSDIRHVLEI